MLEHLLPRIWQRRGVLAVLLLPLTALFSLLSRLRRHAYACGVLARVRLSVPVVVVGNIIVGGSGKTPLTLWLADALRCAGWQPGIISRGYAAAEGVDGVREVHPDSRANEVGDEPLLLKRRSGLPVFVGRDRVAAGRALLAAYPQCDLILSDDGLQHYRLQREVEIAVLDARGVMNGFLLPSGPLRESPQRLASVDALVLNGAAAQIPSSAIGKGGGVHRYPLRYRMHLKGTRFVRLDVPAIEATAADLASLRLAAVCGIAVPERFFQHLDTLGLNFTRHAFPDHHAFTAEDLRRIQQQTQADALLMTEKDAVKFSTEKNWGCVVWVLPVTAELESEQSPGVTNIDLVSLIEQRLAEKPLGSPTA